MTSAPASPRPDIVAAFEAQIGWCERLGSPFTVGVLRVALADLMAGGAVAALLGDWPGDPKADALPLRLAGALHALALSGRDAGLARYYPPALSGPGLDGAIRGALDRHRAFVADWLTSPPQTNEVGRSAVLLGGFLEVAKATNRPLHLLEIGASAGLNSVWDRFGYRLGDARWGDADSPVQLAPDWRGPLPPLDAPIRILSRAACDRRPISLEREGERFRLRAYVWADMTARLRALDGAMALARQAGAQVEAADAAEWVERQLADRPQDGITVLYHTVVWQYLPAETQDRIRAALARHGAVAPLAWLRFEAGPGEGFPLTLTLWQDGTAVERDLADAQAHGAWVAWH